MNNFEKTFFIRYIPEGQEIKGIIHEHWIKIVGGMFFWLTAGLFIPAFLYYYSPALQGLIPFYIIEIIFTAIFIKVVYDIFDWYNDVWIITNLGVVDLDWALFSTDMTTVKYESIEGIEVQQQGIIDTLLNKGDVVIHKIGSDEFRLVDAIIPYDAVNEIEKISKEKAEENSKQETTKFDMVMNALSGVVEDYIGKEGYEINEKSKKNKKKKAINRNEGTIDLR